MVSADRRWTRASSSRVAAISGSRSTSSTRPAPSNSSSVAIEVNLHEGSLLDRPYESGPRFLPRIQRNHGCLHRPAEAVLCVCFELFNVARLRLSDDEHIDVGELTAPISPVPRRPRAEDERPLDPLDLSQKADQLRFRAISLEKEVSQIRNQGAPLVRAYYSGGLEACRSQQPAFLEPVYFALGRRVRKSGKVGDPPNVNSFVGQEDSGQDPCLGLRPRRQKH